MGILAASAVHLLTASGVIVSFFALQQAIAHDWQACFAWLGLALVIDGIDGPLARALKAGNKQGVSSAIHQGAQRVFARFSGEVLDQIIDYLSYAFIPALIIASAPLLAPDLRLPLACLMLISALYHFSDRHSKTADGYFVGFPAIWNIVALYLFVFRPGETTSAIIITALSLLTFIPLSWPHPLRLTSNRPLSLLIGLLWLVSAALSIWQNFTPGWPIRTILAATGLFFIALTIKRSCFHHAGQST